MPFTFQPLRILSRENGVFRIKTQILSLTTSHSKLHTQTQQDPDGELVVTIQNLLNNKNDSFQADIELFLDHCGHQVTEDSVLNVLKRYRSDWKPAYAFFNWVSKGSRVSLTSTSYNEILDTLGKMRRFDELSKVFDEMSKRDNFVDEETYCVLVNRYAAAHKVDEAINVFNKRRDFGFDIDLVAFQKLLMYLCRYKHVEAAETLLYSKGNEFSCDIKTWNIILNGWCVLGNTHEAKRVWKDIIASKCIPDLFTYGIFINALTKKGILGTAMKLFRGCQPDVVICNCIIDALCFKKRIPEALEIFQQMDERGPSPNAATYNSLIKHLCKIRRMEKVFELLDKMEEKSGDCLPNNVTFNFLLKSLKKPEEVPMVFERMERNGCKMTADSYNLVLKLFMDWSDELSMQRTWDDMEKKGFGHDRRSYTIMIHGLFDKGRKEDALSYYTEMASKGMVPEPRTKLLVKEMKSEQKKGATLSTNDSATRTSKKKPKMSTS